MIIFLIIFAPLIAILYVTWLMLKAIAILLVALIRWLK